MLIRMRTQYAGPRGTFAPNAIVEMDKDEAKVLISSGYAVPVSGVEVERAIAPAPERAVSVSRATRRRM
jgi:hypothetical protein